MKVIHIITGLSDGGAEAVLYRLCKSDIANQHVVISLMDEGKYGSLLQQLGVDVHCLNMPAGRIRLASLVTLFKLFRLSKPDVVQTWMYHADLVGGVIARLAGIRNIVWGVHHTTLVMGESKRSTIFIAKLNALLSKFVPRRIIYCAKKSREVQESIGFKTSIGIVVPNGYNTNDFFPLEQSRLTFRASLGISDDIFLIGHVGRYHPFKDYKSLVESISILQSKTNNFKVVLVGTGLDKKNSELETYLIDNDCQDKVLLLGRRDDIPVIMNGLDIFILSSVSEAFPNVLNEAMACGTSCVTTDVGDAGVIVGETGWVVPPKNPAALSSAIIAAMEEQSFDADNWSDRKLACRERIVDNFSIETMVNGYNQVWRF